MDCRLTLRDNETFLQMLQTCFEKRKRVYLMVDENGLERVEGFINSIQIEGDSETIHLENEKSIDLRKIVAVNGIFLSEYGEC